MTEKAKPLGVAVIGYAFMGKAHSNAWRNVTAAFDVPAVERKVLVGRDADQVAEAAARYGWAESATDWRDVIHRDDIDIVDICTPGWTHSEIAIEALKAGKHVLVEKPLSNTLEESRAMVQAAEAARAHGVVSMIGFNYRRVPALAHARALIAEGRIGDIRHIRASYLQDWLADDQSPMTWRLRKETAGTGALGDIASHAIDQVQFLSGAQVSEVSATLLTFTPQRPGPEGLEDVTVDDAAWLRLSLDSGALASVEVSRVALGKKNALSIEVFGSNGSLRFDLENPNELFFLDGRVPVTEQGFTRIVITEPEHPYLNAWWPQGHVIGWEHTFAHQIRDFLLAIAENGSVSPDFAEGLQVQSVLDAAVRSAENSSSAVVLEKPTVRTDEKGA